MRISSEYYNNYYYTQRTSQHNSLANAQISMGSSDTSSDASQWGDLLTSQSTGTSGYGNAMNLNLNGLMMRHALQSQGGQGSEMHQKMEQMRTDMKSVESADIDNMSDEEVKEMLNTIKTDIEAMPKRPSDNGGDMPEIDMENMTASEMRDALKQIQEKAKSMPESGHGGRPPMEGMTPMNGMDLSQLLGDDTSSASAQDMIQQILDKLTESYDSNSESSSDYVSKLKESLTELFTNQKNNIDTFSNLLFQGLDSWSTTKA